MERLAPTELWHASISTNTTGGQNSPKISLIVGLPRCLQGPILISRRGLERRAIKGRPLSDFKIYLDEDAVAALLSVSIRTIQRWRGTGEGPPFVRAGARRVIYSRTAIEQWATS